MMGLQTGTIIFHIRLMEVMKLILCRALAKKCPTSKSRVFHRVFCSAVQNRALAIENEPATEGVVSKQSMLQPC